MLYDVLQYYDSLEVPKHKKKRPSSVSKAKRKANHLHNMEKGLLVLSDINESKPVAMVCNYCTICGKISPGFPLWIPKGIDIHSYLEEFNHLPHFIVHNLWQDYITMEGKK